jgi:hypothetical protein
MISHDRFGPAVRPVACRPLGLAAHAAPFGEQGRAVPCFPTVSEFWLRLLEEFGL